MAGIRLSSVAVCLIMGLPTLVADRSSATSAPAADLPPFAYVTNQGSETVSVVDLNQMVTRSTINVPGKPAGVALLPRSDQLYVTAPEAHDIAVIDLATGALARRTSHGTFHYKWHTAREI